MSKHTPGPWFVCGPLTDEESGRPGGIPVRVVAYEAELGGEDENSILICEPDTCSEADARLIAAAPDLLEALEKCYFYLQNETAQEHWMLEVGAAIAKARGG